MRIQFKAKTSACRRSIIRAKPAVVNGVPRSMTKTKAGDGPPKPEPPSEAERKSLHDEAAKQLATARELVQSCGYHRRDEELAELDDVLAGKRRFADLPPRA
jgi:hypothetical protein